MAWNANVDRLLDLFSEFNEDKGTIYPDGDIEVDGVIVEDGLGPTSSKYRVSFDEVGNRYVDGISAAKSNNHYNVIRITQNLVTLFLLELEY